MLSPVNDNIEPDYPTKLEQLEIRIESLQEQLLRVTKEKNRYKKVCDKLKREKNLDYSEEEFRTV